MTKVAEVNRLFYESAGVAERFRDHTTLCPAEELIIELVKEEIKDQPLLEIGVGAGRVTPFLTALTNDYIGVDCSACTQRKSCRCLKIRVSPQLFFGETALMKLNMRRGF